MDSRQEERVLDFYKKSMTDSLTGNVKDYLDSIGENAVLIGTTQDEWMEGKSAVEERFELIRDQITDNIEIRNSKLMVLPLSSAYMVIARSDVFVKIEGNWNFAFQLRNTTLIEDQTEQLRIVFQHASVPDLSVNKEETLPFEKLKKENDRLEEAVRERTKQLEESLAKLKSTQAQLIQAEKMASLGELTAGIAHEIQNPLNFVNNFSDVSGELLDEAFEEIENKDIDEAKSILNDVKDNLEKIAHHGTRASSIVKGMLDHSRAPSDEKVETDINALCDEYLRLSYHGLRAKDKSFNSDFKTEFDTDLKMIKVIPQELGRVLLNILNNAFYAVDAKAKSLRESSPLGMGAERKEGFQASAQPLTPEGNAAHSNYKPLVTIKTQQINTSTNKHINISITDNGIGMSQETIDKVFQPFFTTKPTGSGTGLGMSISYDIITNGHGGTIEVESPPTGQAGEEGKGTTFTITLPK